MGGTRRMSAYLMIPLLLLSSAFDDTFEQGVEAYYSDNYAGAVREFELLVDQGVVDPVVFYNLGNAYYRLGEVGPAIANYERALQVDPRMTDARENLAQCVSQTERRLNRPAPPQLEQSLLFWHTYFTPGSAFALAALAWTAVWVLLAVRRVKPMPYLRRAAALCAVVALLFAAASWVKAHPQQLAVASAEVVPVRYGTNPEDTVHFELYEGDRVLVDRREGAWARVRTADGQRGWTEAQYMTFVGPPYDAPEYSPAEPTP